MHDTLARIRNRFSSLRHKKHASHAAFIAFAIVFVFASVFSTNTSVFAATYNFVQSSWAGGLDGGVVATHASNQSNWTKYATSTGLTMGAAVQIPSTNYTFTDDGATSTSPSIAAYGGGFANGTSISTVSFTDSGATSTTAATPTYGGGFGNGTNSSTVVSGTGTAAGVGLSSTFGTALSALSPATIAASTNPDGVAVSPDGTSVYVTNYGSNTISMYSRNTSTGLLTALSPATISTGAANAAASAIAISTDGAFVYETNKLDNSISMYSRNTSTGLLTALSPATISTGGAPVKIFVSADDAYVYTADDTGGDISQYSRNTTTGLLTALSPATISTGPAGPPAPDPFDVVISADGKSAYVANQNQNTLALFSRSTTTGLLTAMSPATIYSDSPTAITISPDGKSVYAPNYTGGTLSQYSRDTTTGALTAMSPATVATGGARGGVAISPDGTAVYLLNNAAGTLSQYSRDTTTGLLTSLSPATIATGAGPAGVAVSPDGTSVYVTNYTSGTVSMFSRSKAYLTSGTFTSAVIDTGSANTLSSLSHTPTRSRPARP